MFWSHFPRGSIIVKFINIEQLQRTNSNSYLRMYIIHAIHPEMWHTLRLTWNYYAGTIWSIVREMWYSTHFRIPISFTRYYSTILHQQADNYVHNNHYRISQCLALVLTCSLRSSHTSTISVSFAYLYEFSICKMDWPITLPSQQTVNIAPPEFHMHVIHVKSL